MLDRSSISEAQIQEVKDKLLTLIQSSGALRRRVMSLTFTANTQSNGKVPNFNPKQSDNYNTSRPVSAASFDTCLTKLSLLEVYLVGQAAMYAESDMSAGQWLTDLSQSLQEKDNLEVGIMLLIGRIQPDSLSEVGFKMAIDNIKSVGLWPWSV